MKLFRFLLKTGILLYPILVVGFSIGLEILEPLGVPPDKETYNLIIFGLPLIFPILFSLETFRKIKNGENEDDFSQSEEEKTKEFQKATYPTIPKKFLSRKPKDFVLGKKGINYIYIPMKSDGLNIFCVGTPGSGKSVLLKNIILANRELASHQFNYFLCDVDGLVYRDINKIGASYKAEKNSKLQVVEINNRSSFGWDVFYRIRGEEVSETVKLKAVTDIAEALIEESGDNPYFSDNARKILTGVLLWGIEKGMDFIPIIQKLMRSTLDDLLTEIVEDAEANGRGIILDKLKSFCGKDENESIQDVEATLKQKLDCFSYPDIEYCLRTNPLKTSPAALDDGATNLVFAIPTAMLLTYAPIFRLITMQVLRHCESNFRVEEERRTCIFIDEAARIGKVDGLSALMATARKYHVSIALFYQDLSQFRDIYGKEKAASIQNLCELKIFMSGSGDSETTDYLSSMVGNYCTQSKSFERSKLIGAPSKIKYSDENKPIITGHTLMQLREKDELIVIYFGRYMRFKKLYYFKDKILRKLYLEIQSYNKGGKNHE